MPATVRYDEQYCPIARALDVLGDRWTLLILRELVIGDQRFTDLRTQPPRHRPDGAHAAAADDDRAGPRHDQGAAPAGGPLRVHAHRARPQRRAGPVGAGPVGHAAAGGADDDRSCARARPASTSPSPSTTTPLPPAGIDERYLLRVDGEEITLSSVKGGGPPHPEPDLVLDGPPAGVDRPPPRHRHAGRGAASAADPAHRIKAALANFQRIFRVQ